jgi:hypothetical protein
MTKLVTDDWSSYRDIREIKHKAITVGPMATHIVLPWTHRLFSNLKRRGLDVYHDLRRVNLQHYLDEFVFRLNRRRTRHAAFNTLPPRHSRHAGSVPRPDPQSRLTERNHIEVTGSSCTSLSEWCLGPQHIFYQKKQRIRLSRITSLSLRRWIGY